MQRAEAHIYFLETIGVGEYFYGTTLNDVRYCVEGDGVFRADATDTVLPQTVVLHFPACQGGDVVEGYAIYNYLRGLSARGVKTVARIEGLCASIAVLCAIACDTVEMAEAALLMVHKPTTGGCGLNAHDALHAAALLDKIQAQLVSRYVARTGMDAATANDLIERTSWLTADECISYGFVTSKIADAPIVAPAAAAGVLNYYPKSTPPAPAMAITADEKKSFFNELKEEFKALFKNEAAPAEAPALNAATSFPATDSTGAAVTLYADAAELAVDGAVFTDEALSIAAADGNYTLEDGREITVLAGLVSEMEATDTAADEAAANSAALAVTNAALVAEVATLKAENALQARKVTGLTNKLNKVVPGSTGTPTPAGATQTIANRATAPTAAAAFTIRKKN